MRLLTSKKALMGLMKKTATKSLLPIKKLRWALIYSVAQAIHHLTTRWTPDSLEQRNGRGARQGNLTGTVSIYHYDADGTFDEFKRTMINKKMNGSAMFYRAKVKIKLRYLAVYLNQNKMRLFARWAILKQWQSIKPKKDELEKQERLAKAKKQQSIQYWYY